MLGINICEDAWTDRELWRRMPYETDPIADAVRAGRDLADQHLGVAVLGGKEEDPLPAAERARPPARAPLRVRQSDRGQRRTDLRRQEHASSTATGKSSHVLPALCRSRGDGRHADGSGRHRCTSRRARCSSGLRGAAAGHPRLHAQDRLLAGHARALGRHRLRPDVRAGGGCAGQGERRRRRHALAVLVGGQHRRRAAASPRTSASASRSSASPISSRPIWTRSSRSSRADRRTSPRRTSRRASAATP